MHMAGAQKSAATAIALVLVGHAPAPPCQLENVEDVNLGQQLQVVTKILLKAYSTVLQLSEGER